MSLLSKQRKFRDDGCFRVTMMPGGNSARRVINEKAIIT